MLADRHFYQLGMADPKKKLWALSLDRGLATDARRLFDGSRGNREKNIRAVRAVFIYLTAALKGLGTFVNTVLLTFGCNSETKRKKWRVQIRSTYPVCLLSKGALSSMVGRSVSISVTGALNFNTSGPNSVTCLKVSAKNETVVSEAYYRHAGRAHMDWYCTTMETVS
jgi:hypothetical protein